MTATLNFKQWRGRLWHDLSRDWRTSREALRRPFRKQDPLPPPPSPPATTKWFPEVAPFFVHLRHLRIYLQYFGVYLWYFKRWPQPHAKDAAKRQDLALINERFAERKAKRFHAQNEYRDARGQFRRSLRLMKDAVTKRRARVKEIYNLRKKANAHDRTMQKMGNAMFMVGYQSNDIPYAHA